MHVRNSSARSDESKGPSEHWWKTLPVHLALRREVISILVRHGYMECAELEVAALTAEPYKVGPALQQAFDREGI